jgi:peptidoglycan/xylan/chitin deacetylase (PgdA/CDA1 family)
MESLKFSKVKDVVVVLMHDASNKNLTVEALPQVIDILKSEGYTFGILK